MGKKNRKNNQGSRHAEAGPPRERNEPHHWEGEEASERSRQTAMASHERTGREQLPAGQTKVQRLHKGNQPRGR